MCRLIKKKLILRLPYKFKVKVEGYCVTYGTVPYVPYVTYDTYDTYVTVPYVIHYIRRVSSTTAFHK